MLNSSHNLPVSSLENGLNLAKGIDSIAIWMNHLPGRFFRLIGYSILAIIGFFFAIISYFPMLFFLRSIRQKLNSLKSEIPVMTLDELVNIQNVINGIFEKHSFDKLNGDLQKGSIFSYPFRISFYQLLCALKDINIMAKEQQERDLEIMANGWENQIPYGVIPTNIVDNEDWE